MNEIAVVETEGQGGYFDRSISFRFETMRQSRHMALEFLLDVLVEWPLLIVIHFVHLISEPKSRWNDNFNGVVSNCASFDIPDLRVDLRSPLKVIESQLVKY